MKNLKLVSVVIMLLMGGQGMAFTIEGSDESGDRSTTSGGSGTTEDNTSSDSHTNSEERPWEANYQKPQIKFKDPRQYSKTAH